ncbi:MAG: hypothetical protein ACK5KO_05605 [Arachnia sp.]
MTALMGLKPRLRRARLATYVAADHLKPEFLAQAVAAGSDLLLLAATGDVARDAEMIRAARSTFVSRHVLVATDDGAVAADAGADVVLLERPSEPRPGHEWTLLGRRTRDARTVRHPGRFEFMFIGPGISAGSPVLNAALVHQPVFDEAALPWFAYGPADDATVAQLIGRGVARIAVSTAEADDPLRVLAAARDGLAEVWRSPQAQQYRMRAVTS